MEAKARPFDLVLEEDLAGTEGTAAVDFLLVREEALDSCGLVGVGLEDSLGATKFAFLDEDVPALEVADFAALGVNGLDLPDAFEFLPGGGDLEEPADLAGARPEVVPDLDAGLDAIEFSWKGLPVGPEGLAPRIGSRYGNIQPYERVLQLGTTIVDLILS